MKKRFLFFVLFLALTGVACSEKSKTDLAPSPASPSAPEHPEQEKGFFENTGKKVDKGIKNTGEKIDQGLDKAGKEIQEGFDRAGEKVKDVTD